MKTVCNCGLTHMVGVDGGLRHIREKLVEELAKQGWKIVINPKRTYFPEHDQTSVFYQKEQTEEINENNIIEVCVI